DRRIAPNGTEDCIFEWHGHLLVTTELAGTRQRRRRSNYMSGPPRRALLRRYPGTLLHRLAIVTAVDCVPALLASSAFVNWRGQRHGCRESQLRRKTSRSRRHLEADVRQPTAPFT